MMSKMIGAYVRDEENENNFEDYDGHSFYLDHNRELKEEEYERGNVTLCKWNEINADEQSRLEAKLEIEDTCCECFCDVSKFDAYKNWNKFQDGIYWPKRDENHEVIDEVEKSLCEQLGTPHLWLCWGCAVPKEKNEKEQKEKNEKEQKKQKLTEVKEKMEGVKKQVANGVVWFEDITPWGEERYVKDMIDNFENWLLETQNPTKQEIAEWDDEFHVTMDPIYARICEEEQKKVDVVNDYYDQHMEGGKSLTGNESYVQICEEYEKVISSKAAKETQQKKINLLKSLDKLFDLTNEYNFIFEGDEEGNAQNLVNDIFIWLKDNQTATKEEYEERNNKIHQFMVPFNERILEQAQHQNLDSSEWYGSIGGYSVRIVGYTGDGNIRYPVSIHTFDNFNNWLTNYMLEPSLPLKKFSKDPGEDAIIWNKRVEQWWQGEIEEEQFHAYGTGWIQDEEVANSIWKELNEGNPEDWGLGHR